MEKEKLSGRAFTSGEIISMLELINGGPETGLPPVDVQERFKAVTKGKIIGRVFVTSTVEDMDKGNDCRELWMDSKVPPPSSQS